MRNFFLFLFLLFSIFEKTSFVAFHRSTRKRSILRYRVHDTNLHNCRLVRRAFFVCVALHRYLGVTRVDSRWEATISSPHNGAAKGLGVFDKEIDAAKQYDKYAKVCPRVCVCVCGGVVCFPCRGVFA